MNQLLYESFQTPLIRSDHLQTKLDFLREVMMPPKWCWHVIFTKAKVFEIKIREIDFDYILRDIKPL